MAGPSGKPWLRFDWHPDLLDILIRWRR